MKKDNFKFKKEDVGFWRSQTKDLKRTIDASELVSDSIISSEEDESEFLELKAGPEELLKYRKIFKEPMSTLPDLDLSKSAAGVDKNTHRKFATGRMPVEARLDMHSMTHDIAFDALIRFINNSFDKGLRCVSVTTGKGRFSKNGGVLKRSFPIWVNNSDIRPKILSFCQAPITDGGSGAYYLFLKRKR